MDKLAAQLGSLELDNVREKLVWLDNPNATPPDQFQHQEQLCDWIRTGNTDLDLIRLYDYCAPNIVDGLEDSRKLVSKYSEVAKCNAKKATNLFELVGRHIFTTRSSMKCANLDALLGFTNPIRPDGQALVTDGEFTYADVTNTDDVGVIEYIQWRKGRYANGYAFLNGKLWNHADPDARPSSQLQLQISGDSTDPVIIRKFIASVRSQQPDGVHLAYCDRMRCEDNLPIGIRENYIKQQMLSFSALCAALVRPNGTIIFKILESLTPFTVSLLYLLRQCFAQMCLIKPVTSRPQNGEQYLILRWCLPATETIVEHLLASYEASTRNDIVELVPAEVIAADTDFVTYLRQSNERLAIAQTRKTLEVLSYLKNKTISECLEQQIRLREQCFRQWNIPNYDAITKPKIFVARIMKTFVPFCGVNDDMAIFENAAREFRSLDEWVFSPVSIAMNPTFFLSMGENRTLAWSNGSWIESGFSLPFGTLLYGESVRVYKNDEHSHKLVRCDEQILHAIDLLYVGFKNLCKSSLANRRRRLRSFITEIDNENVGIRDLFPVTGMMSYLKRRRIFEKVKMFKISTTKYYQAGGFCLYKGLDRNCRKQPVLLNMSFTKCIGTHPDESEGRDWFEQRLAMYNMNTKQQQ